MVIHTQEELALVCTQTMERLAERGLSYVVYATQWMIDMGVCPNARLSALPYGCAIVIDGVLKAETQIGDSTWLVVSRCGVALVAINHLLLVVDEIRGAA